MTEPTTNDQRPTTHRLLRQRVRNQLLDAPSSLRPEEVVASLVAVQAQDYSGAKWALGLRAGTMTDGIVEQACDAGAILRTHVLRPTWHFVAPADIRWLLALTGPRVQALNRTYHRKLEIGDALLASSRRAIERALARETGQTRTELAAALRRAGIEVSGVRLALVVMHAELEGVICSGPRRGKQFTYALMDLRAPQARRLNREEALAELTRRYLASHGPATIRDYAWWSGLGINEARRGVEIVRAALEQTTIEKLTYWFTSNDQPTTHDRPTTKDQRRPTTDDRTNDPRPKTNDHHSTHLLPNYDEYLIAYQDRGLAVPRRVTASTEFPHQLIVEGRLAGSWRRRAKGGSVIVEIALHRPLNRVATRAVGHGVERLSRFLGAPIETIFVR